MKNLKKEQECIHTNPYKYPSKEDILELLKIKPNSLKYEAFEESINIWRKARLKGSNNTQWNKLSIVSKSTYLIWLCKITLLRFPEIGEIEIKTGSVYMYLPHKKTIILGEKPSIISTLHELAHAIFKCDEKDAVYISLSAFKQIWPESFKKLTFKDKGHILIKNE